MLIDNNINSKDIITNIRFFLAKKTPKVPIINKLNDNNKLNHIKATYKNTPYLNLKIFLFPTYHHYIKAFACYIIIPRDSL